MYVDDKADSQEPEFGAAGHGMFVHPDELERQADHFANLGDELRQHVGRGEVRPPMLGTSPPALWLAMRLAHLVGPDGAPKALRHWGNGLGRLGKDERAVANAYRNTDNQNEVTFNHIDTSVPMPGHTACHAPDHVSNPGPDGSR